jgi:hypothetical protein
MSKSKVSPDAVGATLTGMADQIESPVLSKVERDRLKGRNRLVPDQLVEMICHLAEQNGGQVLGMAYDAAQARATLAQTSAARTHISVTRQLLQRMEDDMIQQRATVADPSFAVYTALRRLVNTKMGNHLSPAYEQMKQIVKNRPRTPRKKVAKAAAGTVAPTTAPATPESPAQAPAPKASATTSTSA